MKKAVRVSVPASSGNIGPGFDVLGLALGFRNELRVRVLSSKEKGPRVRIVGEGQDSLPTDSRNIILRTMAHLFKKARRPMPNVELVCVNRIPLARGLGSSSAAYLAGLLAANRLLNDRFSKDEILAFATELEGHPDNVAPALFGGARASGVYDGRVVSAPIATPRLRAVVAIPSFELSTKKARKVLPKTIPMKDAIANLSAVALMSSAFSGGDAQLKDLLNDRWHEPYRAKLIPGFYAVKKAALRAGAEGVILSGAGPTMLSFVKAGKTGAVAKAMRNAFAKAGVTCRTREFSFDKKGAVLS